MSSFHVKIFIINASNLIWLSCIARASSCPYRAVNLLDPFSKLLEKVYGRICVVSTPHVWYKWWQCYSIFKTPNSMKSRGLV